MTFEARLKQMLGEQVWTALTLVQRLEEAQARIVELEKPNAKLAPANDNEPLKVS